MLATHSSLPRSCHSALPQLRWLKQHVPTAFGRWATSIKAAPTTAESLKQLLLQLAWTAPKGTLSPAETAMLTEMLTGVSR
jgi:hypothetical protein